MSRITLGVLGVTVALMGIVGLIPSWTLVSEPAWYAWIKIVIGIIAVIIAVSDSGK